MARFIIYVMLLGAKLVNSCRQSLTIRCNPGIIYIMTMARFTIYVTLLSVKVVISCALQSRRRRRRRERTPAPAPGLYHDYGLLHNLGDALRR